MLSSALRPKINMLAVYAGVFLTLLSFSECVSRGGLPHHGRDLKFLAQGAGTELANAIFNDDVPAVKRLIKCKCSNVLEAPQFLGKMPTVIGGKPLHLAVELQNLPIVKLLVNAGANVNARSPLQASPLHVSAITSVPILSFLIKKGAGVNVQDSLGDSPLHYAVIHSNLEAVKLLLEAGANPNVRDTGFYSPLHEAAAFGGAESVEALIEAGANPNVRTKQGLTPLEVVCACTLQLLCMPNQCSEEDAQRTKEAFNTVQRSNPSSETEKPKTKKKKPKKTKPKKEDAGKKKLEADPPSEKAPEGEQPPPKNSKKEEVPLSPLERLKAKLDPDTDN